MAYQCSAEILVQAPRAAVWDALTNPDLVKQYFFGTNLVTTWKVGSPLRFHGEWEGKTYEDRGTVLSFEPTRSFSFDYWSSMSGLEDKPELRQIVRYELEETPNGVRVTVTQSNTDTKERADHSAENWKAVLEAMKALVESSSRDG